MKLIFNDGSSFDGSDNDIANDMIYLLYNLYLNKVISLNDLQSISCFCSFTAEDKLRNDN